MDNPNALEAAAGQLQKVASTFQQTVDVLQSNTSKLSLAASDLVSSGGNAAWTGQSAAAFLGAWEHLQQASNNCIAGLDQASSACQSAAGAINNALPALFNAQSAEQVEQHEKPGKIEEWILKAIEDGNRAQANLTSSIDSLKQTLELATAALGECDEQGGDTAGDAAGDNGGEDPFLAKLVDIAKDDLKDKLKEALIERLTERIKEWQKEHSGS